MKKDVSKLLYIVMMVIVFGASMVFGQGDFFKYSTFYTSMTMNTSFTERSDYIAIDKGYDVEVDSRGDNYDVGHKHGGKVYRRAGGAVRGWGKAQRGY